MEHPRDPFAGQLYSGVSYDQWIITHGLAVAVTFVSLACSTYHIHKTVQNWRSRRLRTMQKLPLWISCSDALFALIHGLDHAVSISTGYVSTGPLCQFFGWSTIFVMNASTFWVTTIAFYLWIMIVRSSDFDWGKYDWKLHVWNWGLPLVWSIIPEITGDYGQEPLWCGAQGNLFLWNGSVVLAGVATSAVFYGHLAWFLHGHRKAMSGVSKSKHSLPKESAVSSNRSRGKMSNIEEGKPQPKAHDRVAALVRDLPIFAAISIFQWSPYLVYTLLPVAQETDYLLDIVVTTAVNARGIINTFAYLRIMREKKNAQGAAGNSSNLLTNRGASATVSTKVQQTVTVPPTTPH